MADGHGANEPQPLAGGAGGDPRDMVSLCAGELPGHPAPAGDDRHRPGDERFEEDRREPRAVAVLIVGQQGDVGAAQLADVGRVVERPVDELDARPVTECRQAAA
ncbi:MAG: hypothetical protein FJ275_06220, partial [Planctomycetes bacterium]|nr:hypothetical protein [Planctomycetota bacterium]